MKAIKVLYNILFPAQRSTSTGNRSASTPRHTFLMSAAIICAATYSSIQAQTTSEAENLARASSTGTTTAVETNAAYSNTQSVKVNSTAIGNYCQWTIPNVAAGTYTIAFYYKKQNSRGIVQASIDGVNQGTPTDMYGTVDIYKMPAAIGSKTFTTAGNKVIRLTVTGKFATSTGYSMHIDYFVLTPTQGCTAPVITAQPLSQTVAVGQTATFTVSATGTATISYQWKKSGFDIAGATAASYTTPATTAADNQALYTCRVYNGCGDITSATATLTVSSPVSVGLVDIDGNIYQTVKIGRQEWSAENLRVTKLNDGTPIPNVTATASWLGLYTPGYCWYNNDIDNKEPYGALYNWFVVNTGKLAPAGWRVPTDADWTALENYLIANKYNYDYTTIDNKIAKSMASQSHWRTVVSEGKIGNDLMQNNASGFSGLPGGFRYYDGTFLNQSSHGVWWGATEDDLTSEIFVRMLYYGYEYLYRGRYIMRSGFSVRLVRDIN
jgi:uncharacterized protein (TIGR02145 family)